MHPLPHQPATFREVVEADLRRAARLIIAVQDEIDWQLRIATPSGDYHLAVTMPTDDKRAPAVFKNTSGFVYYVSVLGITGTKTPDLKSVEKNVKRLRNHTNLPIAVGFGVKTAAQARAIAKSADGVVVGSALVTAIKDSLTKAGKPSPRTVKAVHSLVSGIALGLRS